VKTLYLLRHGKSSWDNPALSDIERPLNRRGERDAPRMGAALAARYRPMNFHVSPAERAQRTFEGLRSGWPGLQSTHGTIEATLYTFDYRTLLDWMAQGDDNATSLAVVGHNPALTELIQFFAGPTAIDNLPTAGWAELAIQTERWSEIYGARERGELVYQLLPRTLREAS